MKPAPFTYHDPTTVDEAVALLAKLENARPLAGGQSLMPMMNFRFVMPDHIIDLNGIAGLDAIRHRSRAHRVRRHGTAARDRTRGRDTRSLP